MRITQTWPAVLVGAIVLTAAQSPARADGEKPRVGITVAVKVNVTDIEARLLSDSLGKALREKFDIEVVAGEDAESRLPEGGLPETCIAETACLHTAADSLGVETLLVLVAVRVGESVQVDATLFDAESGASNTRPPVRMTARERQWQDAFAASADQILPGAPVRTIEPEPDPQKGNVGDPGGNGAVTGPGDGGAVTTRSSPGFFATRTTLSWVLGGLTVAAVGVGTVAGLRALSLDKEMPSRCPSDDQCAAAKIATGSFVAAGLLGAGFLYTFLFTEKDIAEPADQGLGLRPGPGDIGLAVGGRF